MILIEQGGFGTYFNSLKQYFYCIVMFSTCLYLENSNITNVTLNDRLNLNCVSFLHSEILAKKVRKNYATATTTAS